MAFPVSVNLEYLFGDAGERIEDRIAAAAAAGFDQVELFLTAGRGVASLKSALDDHGVRLISTVADFRTQLVEPETHAAYRDIFRAAAEDAAALGCPRVVVAGGRGVPWMKRDVQLGIVADAVAGVIPIAEEHDLTIVLESANTRVDHPGVLTSMTVDSVAIIERLGSPRVRLLYDLYHSIVEGEDPVAVLPKVIRHIDHVQVADAPGRGVPGTGAVDWPAMLALLRRSGYDGTIGLECHGQGEEAIAGIAAFRELAASA